ncbi:MAG TPA: cytochrome P450 [Rhodobiaceae bacterium]|nr:cytochrome P450 [Rhodobiaceae bacterium]
MVSTKTQTPKSDIDLFSDETLQNTEFYYKALRDLGPIVHLPKNELYAITQFEAVRVALRDDAQLINGKGVAANPILNDMPSDATLISDGETHLRRRSILMRPLMPKTLANIKDRIETSADILILDLVSKGDFCGVAEFATHLPLTIVAELVGLEDTARENMLVWAAATFDALGPLNNRTQAALDTALGLIQYVSQLKLENVRPGSWAADILTEAQNKNISPSEAAMMIVDYVAPSLDTTILASAHMLWRLGTTPDAFTKLRDNPDLIASAVNESVRLASPIREFTRFAIEDYETDAGVIPAESRVAVLYASANWDERHYPNADQFQLERNPRDHVGWGHGAHICVGMNLARLEMECLLKAMVNHVGHIETGDPTPILNNVLQGFQKLPARFKAA